MSADQRGLVKERGRDGQDDRPHDDGGGQDPAQAAQAHQDTGGDHQGTVGIGVHVILL